MKLSNIKVDAARAEAGEWVTDIPEMEDLRLKVRGALCASARALRNQLIRALPAKVRNDPKGIPLEKLDEIEAKVNERVILQDWGNFDDIPYSQEVARQYLTDPDYIMFREAVAWASQRVGRDAAAAQETELKNSEQPSAGP